MWMWWNSKWYESKSANGDCWVYSDMSATALTFTWLLFGDGAWYIGYDASVHKVSIEQVKTGVEVFAIFLYNDVALISCGVRLVWVMLHSFMEILGLWDFWIRVFDYSSLAVIPNISIYMTAQCKTILSIYSQSNNELKREVRRYDVMMFPSVYFV